MVDEFLHSVGNNWQPSPTCTPADEQRGCSDPPDVPICHPPSQQTTSEHNAHTDSPERQAHTDRSFSTEEGFQPIDLSTNMCSDPPSPNIRPDALTDLCQISSTDSQKADNKKEFIAKREELTTTPTKADLGARPCNRPKKRCSKRLHHPIRRNRNTQLSKSPTPSPATNKGSDRREKGKTLIPPSRRTPLLRKTNTQQRTRVRSSPLVGQSRNAGLVLTPGALTINVLSKLILPSRLLNPQTIEDPQEDTSPPSIVTSTPQAVLSDPQAHPVRVTIQPYTHHKRTPFDNYKGTGVGLGVETNSSKFAAKRLGIPEPEFKELLTKEINELLGEIERTRLAALGVKEKDTKCADHSPTQCEEERQNFATHPAGAPETSWNPEHSEANRSPEDSLLKGNKTNPLRYLERSGRRIKEKCHFGPLSKRGRGKLRTSSPSRRDPPPPPPFDRTPTLNEGDGQERPLFGDGQGRPTLGEKTHGRPGDPDRIQPTSSYEWDPQVQKFQMEDDTHVVLPDRPTFFHFTPAKSSPFARYSKTPITDVRLTPFGPVHACLGLSEEEFEARLTSVIDSVLVPRVDACCRAKELECEAPPSPHPILSLPVMTKEDGLRFFRHREFPSTGPLLGVYRWAADLGRARFNFDFDFDRDDLSILNAYD